jgi:hypothetical protein
MHDDHANSFAIAAVIALQGGATSISEMIANNAGVPDRVTSGWTFFDAMPFLTDKRRGPPGVW